MCEIVWEAWGGEGGVEGRGKVSPSCGGDAGRTFYTMPTHGCLSRCLSLA